MDYIENIVIGGGQAGLATSYYLSKWGREHIVFEQAAQPANVWRNERWDSFTLVTPNWTVKMPGIDPDSEKRDGFMPRDEIVEFFENYSRKFRLPVMYNSRVSSVEKTEKGFLVTTSRNSYKAKNVVVATGFFQIPKIPHFSSRFKSEIVQLHATMYRNPALLPPGAVLVVGSGQSGCQITEELYLSGRKVFQATGSAGRVPRRYRGKDVLEWFEMMHFLYRTPEQLPPGTNKFSPLPHVSGTKGGHSLNLHKFARDGVKLLGHMTDADNYTAYFANDLYANLKKADQFEENFRSMVDEYILKNNLSIPPENPEVFQDGFKQPVTEVLDLKSENINSVVWAGGYTFDYSIIKLPIYDSEGFIDQKNGVTKFPGLYFVGIPWMPSLRSGILIGVDESAKYIAQSILDQKTNSIHEAVA